ncbi:PI31 proteasome regulator N-terminal-domain-containing protein [Daedaleopsis nitida]|nr:PI31 proteasome regulator N-terminal-domain-containing protein [Daedaleopsis nitida]
MSFRTLDALALLEALPSNLPSGKKKLDTPQDAVAALVHTMLSFLGFHLIAVDENTPAHTYENNVLPAEWNQHGPSTYTFKYKHEHSTSELLVKLVKLGSRVLISSIATESEKIATLDLSADDVTAQSFFPYDFTSSNAAPLADGFISTSRVDDFVSQFKLTTLRELMPGLPKAVPTERDSDPGPSRLRETEAAPPARVQLEGPTHPQASPQPPRGTAPFSPPNNPLEIGRRDRDPFPSNPFAPPPLFPGNGGDGMFVGPDHPIFDAGMRGRGPGGMGPWGGDGFLPPLGAPPGARFDPVGPGFAPGAPFPGRGMNPRGGGGPFGGQDPDFDDFPPPGSRDMFS